MDTDPGQVNGTVDLTSTTFWFRGTVAQAQDFFGQLLARLSDPPVDRLAHERRVLEAEASWRQPSLVGRLLAVRYGFRGPGVLDLGEVALRWIGAEQLRAHASTYFVADNAVLWATAPLDLDDLQLPRGTRCSLTLPQPQITEPTYYVGGDGVDMQAVVPRSTAAGALTRILGRRLERDLRHRRGIAYAATADYLPLTGEQALLAVSTVPHPEHAQDVRNAVVHILHDLRVDGPTEDELAYDRAQVRQTYADTQIAVPAALDMQANQLLNPSTVAGDWLEELSRLQAADLAYAAQAVLAGAPILVGPQHAETPPPGFQGPASRADVPVPGRWVPHRYQWFWPAYLLRASDQGVSIRHDQDDIVTIHYDEVGVVYSYEDGSRALLAETGRTMLFDAKAWWFAGRITHRLDKHLDSALRIDQGPQPPRDDNWHRQSWKALLTRLGFLLAMPLGLLTLLAVPGLGLLIIIVAIIVKYTMARKADPRPPST